MSTRCGANPVLPGIGPLRYEALMGTTLRERLALYLTCGIFVFSALFVGLSWFTPEFGATTGPLAGIIIGGMVTGLVGIMGADSLQRSLNNASEASSEARRTPGRTPGRSQEDE